MLQLLVTLFLVFWGATGLSQTTANGRFVWLSDDPNLGGMSGIEFADDGVHFIAVSDRGFVVEGRVTRDANGRITDVTHGRVKLIERVDPDRGNDAEGIALSDADDVYVAFEGTHQVARIAPDGTIAERLPQHPDFPGMQNNSSLEALAIDATGALYTIPERSGRFDRPFPIYRYRNGVWDIPYALPRVGSFLVVGADVGPDGMLYVLERDFTGFSFLNRVRRVDLESGTSDTVLLGGGQFGNLEGLSVWQSPKGLMLSMIADDNYNVLLQTEIVEYLIDG